MVDGIPPRTWWWMSAAVDKRAREHVWSSLVLKPLVVEQGFRSFTFCKGYFFYVKNIVVERRTISYFFMFNIFDFGMQ